MRVPRVLALAFILTACGPVERAPSAPAAPDVSHLPAEQAQRVTSAHAAAVSSDSGADWERCGRELFRAGEMAAAEEALLRASTRDGSDRAGCLHAAGVATDGLDRERAAEHFKAALAAGSTAPSTRLRLARILEQLGRLDDAEIHYVAVTEAGASSHALLGLGRIAMARGDLDAAISRLNRAHAVDDRHTEVLIALAQAYSRAGDTARAEQFARAVGPRHQETRPPDDYVWEFLSR